MERKKTAVIIILGFLIFGSCRQAISTKQTKVHLLHDHPPMPVGSQAKDSSFIINAIIEISAGTNEKWEVDKNTGELDIEIINGKKRTVEFLPYPANYGMIPQTLLSETSGGDGGPLDVFVIGTYQEPSSLVEAKLIGVMKILDKGQQDDKLIAIHQSSPLYTQETLNSLSSNYPAVLEILKIWVSNYKDAGSIEFQEFSNETEAYKILKQAINEYRVRSN